jgi:integrase
VNCRKKHGTWCYVVELPRGPDGRRRQTKVGGFPTERHARAALNDATARIERGTFVQVSRTTVATYLDDWLEGKAALRASTRRSYAETIDLYLKPALGHHRLTDLRDHHIADLYAAMRQLGTVDQAPPGSPLARIRRVHATLRSALNSAVKRHLIDRNPAQYVDLPTGRRPRAVVWSNQQVQAWHDTGERPPVAVWTAEQTGHFLDTAADDRLYPLFHLIAYRGLRRGEAVGLRWRDVDLNHRLLHIRQQIVQVGWATQVSQPKTHSGNRTVTLDQGTTAVLRAWRHEQEGERALWGAAWQHTDLVFTRQDGSAIHPDTVSRRFAALTRAADLPPIRLHDLRHTAASLALVAGVPMKVVSELLGHASLAITADTYTSVLPEVADAAAEAVFRVIPRAAPPAPPAQRQEPS